MDGPLAAEAARELKEAVDLEAILADQPADEPIDGDRLADALGRPIGQLLAHRIVDAGGMSGFAKRKVVTDAVDRVATRAIEVTAGAADLGTDGTTDSSTTGGHFGGGTGEPTKRRPVGAPGPSSARLPRCFAVLVVPVDELSDRR